MELSQQSSSSSRSGRESPATAEAISFVIPVYNEQESITLLVDEIDAVCKANHYEYEIIIVSDGSTDATWDRICALAAGNSAVQGIKFARRFGKACALNAGFQAVLFETVIQMDGDLQDNPVEIPAFLAKLADGFDLVCGYKKNRQDPLNRVIGSRIYNSLTSFVSGVKLHDHNCGYKAYRKPVLTGLNLYGEMHRHIPLILNGRGARIGEIVVNHRPREFGKSKFGTGRIVKGLLDLMTVMFLVLFRQRPLHILGGLGLAMFVLGFAGLVYLAIIWATGAGIGQRPLLVYSSSALILGFQLFATGILAELITFYMLRPSLAYVVAETVDSESSHALHRSPTRRRAGAELTDTVVPRVLI